MSDTSLNKFVGRGTTAERLAFTPSPGSPATPPEQGYIFWDTDLQIEFAYDIILADWIAIGGSGSSSAGYVDHRLLGGI